MIERLLLDTHAPLWALTSPGRLPGRVAKAVRATETDVYVSPVATWEIAIKSVLGKINADVGIVAGGAAPHTSTSSQSPLPTRCVSPSCQDITVIPSTGSWRRRPSRSG